MEFEEYLEKKKEIQKELLLYIDDQTSVEENFQNFCVNLEIQRIQGSSSQLSELLHLISKISNNHHRSPNFFTKIEQILHILKESITSKISNSQLFNIFKGNKRILLFLIENKYLTIDKYISKQITNDFDYCFYFFPEIRSLIDDHSIRKIERKMQEIGITDPDDFEARRKEGDNECEIAQIIRNDSVDEFVSFVKNTNFSLTSQIKPSMFETNLFLIDKSFSLIEYSAFCNSINIFNYLCGNPAVLTPSLWLYAIHGNSLEIIQLLEKNNVVLKDKLLINCVAESIKCHHNEIAQYLIQNKKNEFDQNVCHLAAIESFNFVYISNNLNNIFAFYKLCEYCYASLVEILLNASDLNPNVRIISSQSF
ncbi:hypothetical protein M9Y10_015201 [Tritrichomonas musculus]|uniref:DUF3447 domain-containing protein n=1 Tax=Tritrichomonas musculus TaxID=1915356 RepID=A0ABR2L1N5_9EUKA